MVSTTKLFMDLVEAREGRTQTQILATIADYQYNRKENPRQKQVKQKLPLSKGAISNNCKKLTKQGLTKQKNGKYTINKRTLNSTYKEHLENYLTRESKTEIFKQQTQKQNEIRTKTKKEKILQKEKTENIIYDILIQTLISSIDKPQVQTLREVFLWTDQIISKIAQQIIENENFETKNKDWEKEKILLQLAVSIDKTHTDLEKITEKQKFLKEYFPSQTSETKMIEKILGR